MGPAICSAGLGLLGELAPLGSNTWTWLCLPGCVLYGQSKTALWPLCPWRWVCAWPTCSTLLWPRARGLSLWATWVAVCHAWEQPPLQALLHVRRTPDQQHTGPPDLLKAALSDQIQNLSWNLSDRQQYLPWVWSTLCSKHLNVLAAQVMSEDVLVSSAASSAVLERGRRGDCRSRKFC